MEKQKITINDLPRVIWVKYPGNGTYPEEIVGYQLDLFAVWKSDRWCLSYCDGADGYMDLVISWVGTDIDKLVEAAHKWFEEHPAAKNEDGNPEYSGDDFDPVQNTLRFEID